VQVDLQIAQNHENIKNVQLDQLLDSVDVDVTLAERVQVHFAHVVKNFAENAVTLGLVFDVV
jgi:hypothetical protein